MTEKLLVPDIGDFENVEVIELLVKEGQEIKKNDPVVTIESDKSSVEIPSTFSGKIETIKVYREQPTTFAVVKPTDIIGDFIKDIETLLEK